MFAERSLDGRIVLGTAALFQRIACGGADGGQSFGADRGFLRLAVG